MTHVEKAKLLEGLRERGSIGLDLSPGDPVCWSAFEELSRLYETYEKPGDINFE